MLQHSLPRNWGRLFLASHQEVRYLLMNWATASFLVTIPVYVVQMGVPRKRFHGPFNDRGTQRPPPAIPRLSPHTLSANDAFPEVWRAGTVSVDSEENDDDESFIFFFWSSKRDNGLFRFDGPIVKKSRFFRFVDSMISTGGVPHKPYMMETRPVLRHVSQRFAKPSSST